MESAQRARGRKSRKSSLKCSQGSSDLHAAFPQIEGVSQKDMAKAVLTMGDLSVSGSSERVSCKDLALGFFGSTAWSR
jgi:hypothetical protein